MVQDKCFQCGTAIPWQPGYVPMCVPCARAEIENYRRLLLLDKKLSAMGAKPGRKTNRAARLRAICALRVPAANDNGQRLRPMT